MKFNIRIGIETHIRLKSKNKLLCNCINIITEEMHKNICPICTGTPGTLPRVNLNCITMASRLATALNCEINYMFFMERKHYNFPDMGKMRQTTQEHLPLGKNGKLIIFSTLPKNISISKLALEEDAGQKYTKNNLNIINDERSGSPLIELVTEPVIDNVSDVIIYLTHLRNLCIFLDLINPQDSSALRSDINLSLYNNEQEGARIELKNINSLTNIKNALIYEIDRQTKLIISNQSCRETRGWDESKKQTINLREKETESQYLFMPEFDIPPFNIEKLIHVSIDPNYFLLELLKQEKIDLNDIKIFQIEILKLNIKQCLFLFNSKLSKDEIKFRFNFWKIIEDQDTSKFFLLTDEQINTLMSKTDMDNLSIKTHWKYIYNINFENWLDLISIQFINSEDLKQYILEFKKQYNLTQILKQHLSKIVIFIQSKFPDNCNIRIDINYLKNTLLML